MNNFEKIEKAVDFIEENLKEDIHLEHISSEAFSSKYHFHRLFQHLTGETLFNYIRKRRLTEAASDILKTKQKIWLIAADYQFSSPEAFSRSFKKAFGVTPVEYRKKNERQIYFGRVKLSKEQLKHITSNITLEPVYKQVDKIILYGKELTITRKNIVPLIELWYKIKDLQQVGIKRKHISVFEIHRYVSNPNHFINHDNDCTFHKFVGAEESSLILIPDDFKQVIIPKGNYAVFTHTGTRYDARFSIDYIWGTWMMKNDIEQDRPGYEYYGEKFLGPYHKNSLIEYYLPVK